MLTEDVIKDSTLLFCRCQRSKPIKKIRGRSQSAPYLFAFKQLVTALIRFVVKAAPYRATTPAFHTALALVPECVNRFPRHDKAPKFSNKPYNFSDKASNFSHKSPTQHREC